MNKKLTAEQREPMCLVCQMGITDDPCYCDELTAHIEPEDECERCHGVGELLHTPTGEYELCPECHTEPEDEIQHGTCVTNCPTCGWQGRENTEPEDKYCCKWYKSMVEKGVKIERNPCPSCGYNEPQLCKQLNKVASYWYGQVRDIETAHTEPEDDNRKGIAFSVLVDYCREVGGMKANIIGYFDWLQQDGKDKAEQEIIDDQEALRHHHG